MQFIQTLINTEKDTWKSATGLFNILKEIQATAMK